jgi:PadR family transcriptional regulator
MCKNPTMARRDVDSLTGTELQVLSMAAESARAGHASFYGYEVVRALIQMGSNVVSHTTVYRALISLEQQGLLTSAWEDPIAAEQAGRPRRRLYTLTSAGAAAAVRRAHVLMSLLPAT